MLPSNSKCLAAKSTHEACHFWRLPPELRNTVYEYALIVGWDIDIDVHTKDRRPRLRWEGQRYRISFMLGYTSTCKQIREEALPILFAENRFYLNAYVMSEIEDEEKMKREQRRTRRSIRSWLASVGPQVKHLRNVTVSFGVWKIWYKNWDTDVDFIASEFAHMIKKVFALSASYEASVQVLCRFEMIDSFRSDGFSTGEPLTVRLLPGSATQANSKVVEYLDERERRLGANGVRVNSLRSHYERANIITAESTIKHFFDFLVSLGL